MSHLQVLKIDSSASGETSVTRQLTSAIVDHIQNIANHTSVVERDLSNSEVPFLNPDLIGAYFTKHDERTQEQVSLLKISDLYVSELKHADVLVLGAPMYNFSIPAVLKAYIDLVARVGETFKYTEEGPIGLLNGKKAIVAVATGGTPIGSPYDLVTPYLKTFLGFIGIHDIEFIAIDERGDAKKMMNAALSNISKIEIAP
jgi:FMN-dependent NADH-azoreductase